MKAEPVLKGLDFRLLSQQSKGVARVHPNPTTKKSALPGHKLPNSSNPKLRDFLSRYRPPLKCPDLRWTFLQLSALALLSRHPAARTPTIITHPGKVRRQKD